MTASDAGGSGPEIRRRIWELGMLAPVSRGLRDVALPFLQDIAAATGENAHLAVLDGRLRPVRRAHLRLTVRADRQPLRFPAAPARGRGRPGPGRPRGAVHRGGSGLAAAQLAEVRRRGYAATAEEMTLGTRCVAVPVTDRGGRIFAARGIARAVEAAQRETEPAP